MCVNSALHLPRNLIAVSLAGQETHLSVDLWSGGVKLQHGSSLSSCLLAIFPRLLGKLPASGLYFLALPSTLQFTAWSLC